MLYSLAQHGGIYYFTAYYLYCWHQRKEDDYALRPEWAAAHGEHQRLVCGAEFFAKLLESGLYAED